MNSVIDINGQRVPVRLEDRTGRSMPGSTVEIGFLIAEALVGAIHSPIAAIVRGIVITTSRTATEISVELAEQRAVKRIQLRSVTARQFSDYLTKLNDDHAWDPRVKELLRDALMQDLRSELSRLARI